MPKALRECQRLKCARPLKMESLKRPSKFPACIVSTLVSQIPSNTDESCGAVIKAEFAADGLTHDEVNQFLGTDQARALTDAVGAPLASCLSPPSALVSATPLWEVHQYNPAYLAKM